MAQLVISIRPETPLTEAESLALLLRLIVVYQRENPGNPGGEATVEAIASVSETRKFFTLTRKLEGQFQIENYAPGSDVSVSIITPQDEVLVEYRERPSAPATGETTHRLDKVIPNGDVKTITDAVKASLAERSHALLRSGRFLVVGGQQPSFRDYTLLVTLVRDDKNTKELLSQYFGIGDFNTIARRLSADQVQRLPNAGLGQMQLVNLTVQGQFNFALPLPPGWDQPPPSAPPPTQPARGWLWVLLGPVVFGGLQNEKETFALDQLRITTVLLPAPGEMTTLAGAMSQGVIAVSTTPTDTPDTTSTAVSRPLDATESELLNDPELFSDDPGLFCKPFQNPHRIVGERAFHTILRVEQPELKDSEGRRVLSRETTLDWANDTPNHQAVTLGYGHILEFRVRWRSNGYSLGRIAHTMTLAPRQTRRIVTVESRVVDRVRRGESLVVGESVEQETRRDYSYSDAVQSQLSEWSNGGSTSSSWGAGGGFGGVIGNFVLGGGGSYGRASSSSWQNGGRFVAASEHQSLRDAIRQHGESLRRLESMVVIEQSQEEFVQAVSEVVRNINYCHSLTITYHEILRHLRVDTEVVGARECVFVPLPMAKFDLAQVIRWRDILERGLLKRELLWLMPFLEEKQEEFASGAIPAGARSQHPIKFLSGSIYVRLAISRPPDKPDDVIDEANWKLLAPYTNQPVGGFFGRLLEIAKSRRDALFQREFAPTVAAGWVNQFKLAAGPSNLPLTGADFTLASAYGFNRVAKVDFTYVPPAGQSIKRADLERLTVMASTSLPPSSVANVQSVEIHYHTDTFDRRAASANLAADLINVGLGTVEGSGATALIALSNWEKQNMQELINAGVIALLAHLNENVEYYHKLIWQNLDRDRLYMMLDSIYARDAVDGRSVASVVEHAPVGIMGNSIVYRVAAGAFLNVGGFADVDALNNHYRDSALRAEPMRVSLPTPGLYAQSWLDECEGCEEHKGSTEWVLTDKEPELEPLGEDATASRRAVLPNPQPSQLPATIINLQNAPNVPPPLGLAGILDAVTSADAFRDMAGLATTQANARAAMETAASLASQFGAKAVDLRKAELAPQLAKEKMSAIEKAHQKGAISDEERKAQTKRILDEMGQDTSQKLTQEPAVQKALSEGSRISISRSDGDGTQTVEVDGLQLAAAVTKDWNAVIQQVVQTAESEYTRWGGGGPKQKVETDREMFPTLKRYWLAVYRKVTDEDLENTAWVNKEHWSSAFIGWVMVQAGAGPEFRGAWKHETYIVRAMEGRSAPIRAYDITKTKPRIGDIICNARANSGATFENIDKPKPNGDFRPAHGDFVVEGPLLENGQHVLKVIGGNATDEASKKSDTVGKKTVVLDKDGFVKLKGDPLNEYFAIVRIDVDPAPGGQFA